MSDVAVWRILDVNANRAAEGLRTLDDIARLVREDTVAAQWIKTLRHQLATTLRHLDRPRLLTARCTEHDAGTEHTTRAESTRSGWAAVVTAACERTSQSLRQLEEFSKLIDPAIAASFKELRYEAYDILAAFELRMLRTNALSTAQLYVLIDCSLALDPFLSYIRELADAGADVLQLRDKQRDGGELVRYARAAVATLKADSQPDRSTWLVVNDRVDVALASGAAGVHVGQEDMAIGDVRRLVGNQLWIGVSTHSIEQATTAEAAGADYIGCGPTFTSPTKAFTEFPGVDFLRTVSQTVTIPAFAIGGITLENLPSVLAAGCGRVAVSSAIHASDDPVAQARAFKQQLSIRQT